MFRIPLKRSYIVTIALILQLLWLFVLVEYLSSMFDFVSFVVQVMSIIALLIIINKDSSPDFKLPWIILILTTPILGGIIYFMTANDGMSKKQKIIYEAAEKRALTQCKYQIGIESPQLKKEEYNLSGQCEYLERKGFPLYKHTESTYYKMADDAYKELLEALRHAEKYIFLEYFIINTNSMWLNILKILETKVSQGVEVRILYDDIATMSYLSRKYPKELQKKGIKCQVFNPFVPICSVSMNHRDHRKIAIIDGYIAFTGGFNLSDEYINHIHPYGTSWKDVGVCLKGEASWQMTLMFLTMWETITNKKEDLIKFKPSNRYHYDDGYVQPYAHTPLQGGQIVGDVYKNIINQARDYLYIYTPYLILDSDMLSALTLASQRGVDVRLMLPGVPDKKIIYQMSKSHYYTLLKNGIKIYEYSPGFLHAKGIVCDNRIASVGTANFDFRSLYHSFENGCLFYCSRVVRDLKKDFEETLLQCCQIRDYHRKLHLFSGVYYAILKVFSPLL